MPHLAIQYSANLEGFVDLDALCETIRGEALASGLFELGAVRVRAVRCDHYAIADLRPDNSFLDLEVRIGTGRSVEEKAELGRRLMQAMETVLAPLFEPKHFALSCEIREIDMALSWRRNSIHERLRQPAA